MVNPAHPYHHPHALNAPEGEAMHEKNKRKQEKKEKKKIIQGLKNAAPQEVIAQIISRKWKKWFHYLMIFYYF